MRILFLAKSRAANWPSVFENPEIRYQSAGLLQHLDKFREKMLRETKAEQIALVIVEKEKKHLNTAFYTAHVLHTYVKTPYSDSLQIC